MNAGKSTMLLQSAYNYRERGMDCLIYTPVVDTRFGNNKVASRIGLEAEAVSFGESMDLFLHTSQQARVNPKIACVLIDEAQFLTKTQVYELTEIADKLKIPVLAYGLRTDFRGEPFDGSMYLLAWAEELIEIKTICHCGKKAMMNMRIDENNQPVKEGDQVEIGGNDRYIAMCRRHFKEAIIGTRSDRLDPDCFVNHAH